jgi:hypothetical protein
VARGTIRVDVQFLLAAHWCRQSPIQGMPGTTGDDGTRTRGLCRDSERLTSIFNDFEGTDGTVSHRKCVASEAIVYHDVYHKSIMCSGFGS